MQTQRAVEESAVLVRPEQLLAPSEALLKLGVTHEELAASRELQVATEQRAIPQSPHDFVFFLCFIFSKLRSCRCCNSFLHDFSSFGRRGRVRMHSKCAAASAFAVYVQLLCPMPFTSSTCHSFRSVRRRESPCFYVCLEATNSGISGHVRPVDNFLSSRITNTT